MGVLICYILLVLQVTLILTKDRLLNSHLSPKFRRARTGLSLWWWTWAEHCWSWSPFPLQSNEKWLHLALGYHCWEMMVADDVHSAKLLSLPPGWLWMWSKNVWSWSPVPAPASPGCLGWGFQLGRILGTWFNTHWACCPLSLWPTMSQATWLSAGWVWEVSTVTALPILQMGKGGAKSNFKGILFSWSTSPKFRFFS